MARGVVAWQPCGIRRGLIPSPVPTIEMKRWRCEGGEGSDGKGGEGRDHERGPARPYRGGGGGARGPGWDLRKDRERGWVRP